MEAAAGVPAVARVGSLPIPSARKEWRAVSDHHSVRNVGDEELGQSKLGQLDERTIYEVQQGREPVDMDFRSITVDGSLGDDILQQRIHSICRQREELQQMEVDLRVQAIARSEIMEIQDRYDSQIKEHLDSATKLQEQLHEREQTIHELERRIEERDREIHAIKLDNEAVWAKEDLLREQNKELVSFRQERDHSEVEKAQHIQQIHDLQEHIQEKERQILELQEQHRVEQETIFLKDEQLKVWIARAQEMDALQSTTSHSLQAELRERTEQYNQLWLGYQRQFAEMERIHLHAVQQLQHELADARERNGLHTDESQMSGTKLSDVPKFSEDNGNQLNVNGSSAQSSNNGVLPNGNVDNISSFASTGNASNQTNHVAGVPITPSSLLGMPTYLPPGQVTALHPFFLHQQGIPHSVPSHVPQSHIGHYHSLPALPQWQNQETLSEGGQIPRENKHTSSPADHNLMRSDGKCDYEVNGQIFHPEYLDDDTSRGGRPDSVVSSSGEPQVPDRGYLLAPQPQQSLQQVASQFDDALRSHPLGQNREMKEQTAPALGNQGPEGQALVNEQPISAGSPSLSETSVDSVNLSETTTNNGTGAVLSESFISTGMTNMVTTAKAPEAALLDERSLLACIVRTIPAGGRIRINSTLPNRLGKMLAPLHWHDYTKKYGKLDDFVASHPELFLIEGDHIQLREGAQKTIASELAKVAAAAAAASSPYSSFLPSVAITPVAQSHRIKNFQSLESKTSNGVTLYGVGSISNGKILSRSKDSLELIGPDLDRSNVSGTQSRSSVHQRPASNFVAKQQGRRQRGRV